MMNVRMLIGILAISLIAGAFHNPTAPRTRKRLLGNSFGGPGNASYEYIVVGAGNAGLPLAVRLAEGGHSVAVIEAGSFYEFGNSNYSQIPWLASTFTSKDISQESPQVDWGFQTVPQKGLSGQAIFYPRGKTVGGCSARNYNTYHRGPRGAYKKWADMVGDDSYRWENILPHFKKSINFTPPADTRFPNATPKYDVASLGDGQGPVQVTYGAYAWSFATWAMKAFTAVGIPEIQGLTSGELIGHSFQLFAIDPIEQIRDSAETSFLRKLGLKNPNLVVYPSTIATRILFNSAKDAVGIIIDFGGRHYTLNASKEVILSAGVIQSPQLLMVSGIGPEDTLKEHNIPVIANRPGVGQNLTDHSRGGPTYRLNLVTGDGFANPDFVVNATEEYNTYPIRGPYASVEGDILAFEKLPPHSRSSLSRDTLQSLERYPDDWPDVEYLALPTNAKPGETVPDGFNHGTIQVALVAPFSRGSVTIQSSEMHDHPVIDPRWLSDPRDQEVAMAGYKRVREIFNTDALKSVVIGDEYFPGPNTSTDAEILERIQFDFNGLHHASCTCRMGRPDVDQNAVVDSKARVAGVQNLRVVDASSFALLPPGHPMATVCEYHLHCYPYSTTFGSIADRKLTSDMFAEKIADEILKDS